MNYFSSRSLVLACVAVVGLLLLNACAARVPLANEQAPAAAADTKSVAMFGGGPGRNMVNLVEKNLPTDWSIEEKKEKNLKWTAQLGSISYGGPVVAGGKVYVGTNNRNPRNPKIKGDKGILMCFEEKTGKFLWQAVHDKLPNTDENDWPEQGIASTPAIEGNRLWYVSNRCELICADTEGMANGNDGVKDEQYKDASDADIIWRLDMLKLDVFPCFLANSSPLVAGDLVFVLTGNGVDSKHKVPNPKAPSLVAVEKATGKLKWSSDLPGDKVMEGQWSNPTYAEINGKGQVILPGGDGWLYGLNATDGKLIWKFDGNPKKSIFKAEGTGTKNYFVATPVVYDNKLYVGLGQNPEYPVGVSHFWCIDLTKTGDLSPVNDNFDPKAEANKNAGFVWHFGGDILPKPDRGRTYHFGRTISTAAVHDGLVYIADLDGFLYCLDAKTGKKIWEHDFVAGVWNSPVYMDGKVYIGADDGTMYIFAAGKEKKIINKVEMNGLLKAPVAASNGVLFVMTDKHLYSILHAVGSK